MNFSKAAIVSKLKEAEMLSLASKSIKLLLFIQKWMYTQNYAFYERFQSVKMNFIVFPISHLNFNLTFDRSISNIANQ